MAKKRSNRSRFVGLRFTQEEFDKIEERIKTTTTPRISEYIRRVLLNKPLTVGLRNKSLDDFMAEMILLRTELNHIGNNFNQAVKKLNTLSELPEFRKWLIAYEADRQILLNKIGTIKEKINQISDEWLQ
ncbi:MAG: plasmid mobilization relaxosome protein MobC [Sphingobacteriales bacterium]|nr:plasmid mobilization relaxosome protein MobC [Sphingobacteriales bacterium]OJV98414.1 MAG: mobilization protein [Sphingobacteriales bacterium 44-61]